MSFWLNDNRFVVCLRQISFVNKILYSTLAPGLLVLGWAYFFYLPTVNQIQLLHPKIVDLEQQVVNFKNIIKSIEKEKTRNKKLQLDFDMLSRLAFDFGKVSDFLLSAMTKHNISCSAISPLYTALNNGFSKEYFCVVFKCKYGDLIKFCQEIDDKDVPLKFCFVKIVRWKDGNIKADIVFRNVCVDCA